jgi:hypothetical protein
MHNYYNIFPGVMLDILLIFFLEGIIFYKFIFPMEKEAASNQLKEFNNKLIDKINATLKEYNSEVENIQKSGIHNTNVGKTIDKKTREILKQDIEIIVNYEQNYLKESSKYFLFIFLLTCIGFIVAIIIYYYFCKYMLSKEINWGPTFLSLIFIVFGIIGFEIVYFYYIFLNKKINEKKIIKYFVEEILEKH